MPRPSKQDELSVEGAFRALIRSEIAAQLEPLEQAVRELQHQSQHIGALNNLIYQLSPLTNLLAPFALGGAPEPRRGPGRPKGSRNGKAKNLVVDAGGRACAIIGCKRPSRSKGYCAAHYQKLRMLTRSGRKPASWTEFAAPNSVPELVLPRGRAAHKARRRA